MTSAWVRCDTLRRLEIPTENKGCESKLFFRNLKLYAIETQVLEFGKALESGATKCGTRFQLRKGLLAFLALSSLYASILTATKTIS